MQKPDAQTKASRSSAGMLVACMLGHRPPILLRLRRGLISVGQPATVNEPIPGSALWRSAAVRWRPPRAAARAAPATPPRISPVSPVSPPPARCSHCAVARGNVPCGRSPARIDLGPTPYRPCAHRPHAHRPHIDPTSTPRASTPRASTYNKQLYSRGTYSHVSAPIDYVSRYILTGYTKSFHKYYDWTVQDMTCLMCFIAP